MRGSVESPEVMSQSLGASKTGYVPSRNRALADTYNDGFASVWDERGCFGVGVRVAGSYSGHVALLALPSSTVSVTSTRISVVNNEARPSITEDRARSLFNRVFNGLLTF